MSELHTALLIAVMSLGTLALRFLPFLLFSGRRKVPRVILYLGDVLPSAALGMLVVYCLRNLSFRLPPYGIPELIACGTVVGIQVLKRNSILSILAGTLCYMVLIRLF